MTGRAPAAVHCITADVDGTRSLAAALAGLCVPGDIVLLAGDLGAGKTAFAQGFGRALGVCEPITSPTFALVRQYSTARETVRMLFHADVYRLDHIQEIVDLGLGELVEDGGVAVVEWGDVAEPVLGAGSLTVTIVPGPVAEGSTDEPGAEEPGMDEDTRSITIRPIGTAWDDRWQRLAAAVEPWAAIR
jgi:tRNA threonylcarbamoyladenosine biosynthesis protein TsaE